jgi:serine/threonine protein kinase
VEAAPSPSERPGDTIDRYKLMEQVGEGGFGVVYVAEQKEPVKRRVALKIIKLGMDTKAVVARFEAERQALAMMEHPNIAKVLDAGTTAQGRPYFVMELVRGIRITDYCDQANLSTRQRLELFIQVCQAIQHAHQKGIIHRDIKPSNILVILHDGVPVPKVIDFGIAKATEGRLTEATVYTQLHQFIGTPAYMSPEQAEMSGLDIDTRSDIYSLGVLLYELLVGSTQLATLPGETLTTAAEHKRALQAQDPEAIMEWLVLAPIASEAKSSADALDKEQIPQEAQLRPRAGQRVNTGQSEWVWREVLVKDHRINFQELLGEPPTFNASVAYTVCYLQSETDQTGILPKVGADTRSKVYLNGREIYRADEDWSYTPDQHLTAGVELKARLNVLVFKVVSGVRWLGSVRFTAAGQPVKGIQVTLTPP